MVNLIEVLSRLGNVKENISIKTLTSFKIGGISKVVFYPNSIIN